MYYIPRVKGSAMVIGRAVLTIPVAVAKINRTAN